MEHFGGVAKWKATSLYSGDTHRIHWSLWTTANWHTNASIPELLMNRVYMELSQGMGAPRLGTQVTQRPLAPEQKCLESWVLYFNLCHFLPFVFSIRLDTCNFALLGASAGNFICHTSAFAHSSVLPRISV